LIQARISPPATRRCSPHETFPLTLDPSSMRVEGRVPVAPACQSAPWDARRRCPRRRSNLRDRTGASKRLRDNLTAAPPFGIAKTPHPPNGPRPQGFRRALADAPRPALGEKGEGRPPPQSNARPAVRGLAEEIRQPPTTRPLPPNFKQSGRHRSRDPRGF